MENGYKAAGNEIMDVKETIEQELEQGMMSLRMTALLLSLPILMLLTGCAGRRRIEAANWEQAIRSPKEPFLAGPTAYLLTNLGGFSAKVILERTVPGVSTKPVTGQLVSRENSFVFSTDEGERKALGEPSFIWNSPTGSGYVLNDALQAYAPITVRAQATNIATTPQPGVAEKISGHSTRMWDVVVSMSDGSQAEYNVWKADDLNGIPVRITSIRGVPKITITFADFRPEKPPTALFLPPEGFTKYESTEAMLNELLRRQTLGRAKNNNTPVDLTDPTHVGPADAHRYDRRY
jgi:hypothetical protein